MQFIKKHQYIFATFGISMLIMIIAFAVIGLFPFGDRQIMVVDSWHQYYPFFQELHSKLTSGGSLFYSWNMGMGVNFFLIMAYYAFSPIYLLSVVFPKEGLREFMMLATAIKIALAGTFLSIYLKHTFKREDYSITLFGLLYAFCSFTMGYYWNIMWLDAVMLLPLILLGLNQIVDGKGHLLYVISLAVAMISNFYIGFFICEFLLIYYFVVYALRTTGFSLKHFIKRLFQMGVFSALGIGLAAVVLLPTFRGLQLTHAIKISFPTEFKNYFSYLEIMNQMLAGVTPSVKSGLPNIFSGFVSVYFLMFFFTSKQVEVKEKIISLFLITFFMFSFNINYLNFIWHGFHFPNEVPYRFAFIYSFLIITWAYKGFQDVDRIERRNIWFMGLVLLGYLLVNERIGLNHIVFFVSLGLLAVYSAVVLLKRYEKIPEKIFVMALSALIIGEMILSAILGTTATGSSTRSSYPYLNNEITEAVEKIYTSDTDIYRIEMVKWYTTNDPTLYGYRGVSIFSSTINSNVTVFLQKLGLGASSDANRYLFAANTPLANGMLGIKYFLGRNNDGYTPNAGYETIQDTERVKIYKNTFPLPLGFMVDNLIYTWNNGSSIPFANQEDFVRSALGYPVKLYTNVPIADEQYTNMTRTGYINNRFNYSNDDKSQVGNATITIVAPETKQMYLYMFANRSYRTKVTVGSKTTEYETRRGLVIDVGILEKDAQIKVEFEVQAATSGYFDLQAVTFDETAYQTVYDKLIDEPLKITTFKDTKIVGTVEALEDGILYTSIPYEKGWHIKVDGKAVETIDIKNAMIGIPLTKGTHEITFRYLPNGLKEGLWITLGSLLILIAWGDGSFVFIKKLKKRK